MSSMVDKLEKKCVICNGKGKLFKSEKTERGDSINIPLEILTKIDDVPAGYQIKIVECKECLGTGKVPTEEGLKLLFFIQENGDLNLKGYPFASCTRCKGDPYKPEEKGEGNVGG